ncbi:hypothetical protein MYSTI_01905 [Myxococcus stipitatus DSM 14675]|uniref:Uncharacterized protein n=1 Tax=Myxococcus stipitatus (strain DSM 14675 / JCM 12634 / Mx s8) TaxID=1278073 RepID=L7U376_MYXSD|nr:hypothetical protein [Myxococcus stipitatus]AGC43236.1 hypothetical protein MYSTI_01905 [Myxococcus stipitatus DSM 14675]
MTGRNKEDLAREIAVGLVRGVSGPKYEDWQDALITGIAETWSRDDLYALLEAVRKRVEVIDWTQVRRTCTNCDHEGPVDPDFGLRSSRGKPLPQSWCVNCRANTNYRAKPRKYKVVQKD